MTAAFAFFSSIARPPTPPESSSTSEPLTTDDPADDLGTYVSNGSSFPYSIGTGHPGDKMFIYAWRAYSIDTGFDGATTEPFDNYPNTPAGWSVEFAEATPSGDYSVTLLSKTASGYEGEEGTLTFDDGRYTAIAFLRLQGTVSDIVHVLHDDNGTSNTIDLSVLTFPTDHDTVWMVANAASQITADDPRVEFMYQAGDFSADIHITRLVRNAADPLDTYESTNAAATRRAFLAILMTDTNTTE